MWYVAHTHAHVHTHAYKHDDIMMMRYYYVRRHAHRIKFQCLFRALQEVDSMHGLWWRYVIRYSQRHQEVLVRFVQNERTTTACCTAAHNSSLFLGK